METKRILIKSLVRSTVFSRIIGSIGCLSLLAGMTGQAAPVGLQLIKTVVIRQNLVPNQENTIYTVTDQNNYDQNIFRRPPGDEYKTFWIARDLVYVKKGGLENLPNGNYSLSIGNELAVAYDPGSFSFSGDATALVYLYGVGWGSQNNNGDFIPMLVSPTYEDKQVPTYGVIWERRYGMLDMDRIYLDYVIQVPKNSQIQWGVEMAKRMQNFSGFFSSYTPPVKNNSVFRWRSRLFQRFGEKLNQPPRVLPWKLPNDLKIESFAVADGGKTVYVATNDNKIMAYSVDGDFRWETEGRGPIIFVEDMIIGISPNWREALFIDIKDGKVTGKSPLPKFLPKSKNSLCAFSASDKNYLLMVVNEQSSVLFFQVLEKE